MSGDAENGLWEFPYISCRDEEFLDFIQSGGLGGVFGDAILTRRASSRKPEE